MGMRILGVVRAVMSARRVEMASSRGESGAIALANIVDVYAVLPRRELGDGHRDFDAVFGFREFRVANGGTLGIDDVGMSGFRRGLNEGIAANASNAVAGIRRGKRIAKAPEGVFASRTEWIVSQGSIS